MADAVGYLALAIMVFGLVRKDNENLLFLIGIGVFLWGWHYWLIGSTSGALVHLIAGVGVFLAHFTFNLPFQQRIALASLFSTLGIIASVHQGLTLPDSIAAIGCVVMTFSQYALRDTKMRTGFLAGESLFLVFAFLVGSVPGMLVTLANGVAGVIGLIRLHREPCKTTTNESAALCD